MIEVDSDVGRELMAIEIGKRIRALREDFGYSTQALADAAGISKSVVLRWEMGHGLPTLWPLMLLCQELETTTGALLAGVDKKTLSACDKR